VRCCCWLGYGKVCGLQNMLSKSSNIHRWGLETCAEHTVVPIPIPPSNFISLTHKISSLTHQIISISHPFPHKNDLQSICRPMVLNKSADLQNKCHNVLSKIENSKSRTCDQMHCEETANCQLSRQKAVCGTYNTV